MSKFFRLRAKTCSYLIDDDSEDKKAKSAKNCVIKRKLKFENYNNCLEATQLDNKIKYLEKSKISIDSLKKIIKNSKKQSVLKIQQRFKSERLNVFTEEINKIALSSNDYKRMQSFDSIETYAYGTSKEVKSEKEDIKRNNVIKQCKKVLTLMMIQKKT